MNNVSSFSFIIPSFNSHATLARTLRSILAQSALKFVREIIVADSSNDDCTREVISRLAHPLIKPLLLESKTSPADGRNIGARTALGDILCFIDSDVELQPDWLKNIRQACKEGALLGGGSICLPPDQLYSILPMAQYYLQLNEFIPAGKLRPVTLVPACNMFCERALFERVGGFPVLRAAEDTLFCLKAGQISPVWFVPEAVCAHTFRTEWDGFLMNQELLGRYIFIYRRKHFGSWYYQRLWPLLFIPAFIGIKFFLMLSRVLKAGLKHWCFLFLSFPVFCIGLISWSIGFVKGVFQSLE